MSRAHLVCVSVCVSAFLTTGCSAQMYADLTTQAVDCGGVTPVISKLHHSHEGPSWWTAQCGERAYFCSQLHERAICTDAVETSEPAAVIEPTTTAGDVGTNAPSLRAPSPSAARSR